MEGNDMPSDSPATETTSRGGDLLLDLLRLTGWRVLVHGRERTTAVATRGPATVTAQADSRAEAILSLFEAAIESRRAAARAA
jgi:hypothetical protein